ncbi:MAG: pirin family protein [Cyclobacteriaceae bacterium]|nr:pirin family protein [Cyclobacteriaceae bacterium]
MKKIIHRSESRGYHDYGWLKTRHSFSFSRYYNPERMNFGVLRVLNDDIVSGGAGFGTHPHDNMEIISIPLYGSMVHKDSTGQEMVIREGDVQIMSAGTGLYHSEYNHSGTEDLNFLQIWIIPKQRDIEPRYQQKDFPLSLRKNVLKTVISPDEGDGLWINQDAYLSLGQSDSDHTFTYSLKKPGNGLYIFVTEGGAVVGEDTLKRRDAMAISDLHSVQINTFPESEFLIIEIPVE